jgi:CxxC motif-containing protein (DUF1111 family)
MNRVFRFIAIVFGCAAIAESATTSRVPIRSAQGDIRAADVLRNPAPQGHQLFIKVWIPAEGFGPLANAQSCAACHATPTAGGSGTARESLVPLIVNTPGIPNGEIFQQFVVSATGPIRRRTLPETLVVRRPPSLYGLGLLDAVPERTILEYSDPSDADGDGISGRLPRRGSTVLRFGWKAKSATIEDIISLAFVNELGLTTPLHSSEPGGNSSPAKIEITSQQLESLADFVRLLSPPARKTALAAHEHGREMFFSVGCAACHRPTLRTGAAVQPALANREISPYTDLLVHDMGRGLSDGIAEGEASEREFRTAPLWNVAVTGPPYLHDGRASTLFDAIGAHGGEAETAARRFTALSKTDQQALVEFLKSL